MHKPKEIALTALNKEFQKSMIESTEASEFSSSQPHDSNKLYSQLKDLITEGKRGELRETILTRGISVLSIKNFDDGTLLHVALQQCRDDIAEDLIDLVWSKNGNNISI